MYASSSKFSEIVALRNEKGSYNPKSEAFEHFVIVALRNEKGSYNWVLGW